ncbi:tetratricopeptide repeat protein [Stieleria varia]|uniref:Tetratricopeptide repeat protein n=1 Tax=Stieleria varia TaxID=2528005 RepID=A0A5C6B6N1_9BACT|nr:tetratricopeptide repeat protein [Stieleria varia]TWU07955.1 Tetratricopeptide repeat protein [Stieleria varia]
MSDHADQSIRPDAGLPIHSDIESRFRWWPRLAGIAFLVFLNCVVYVPSLRYEMIFDDLPGIVDNESIHNLFPLFGRDGQYGPLNPQPETPFTARPVVSLSLAINHHFGGVNPLGYRLTNLVMHVITGVILWGVIWRTLLQPCLAGRFARHSGVLSWGAALLWTLHPVHTETVIYLTQRTELMMGLFYLLTLYCSIRFWGACCQTSRFAWLALATLSCASGMLSKEMMASAPAMVAVYEWTFVKGSIGQMIRRSWSLYVGLAATWSLIVVNYALGRVTPLGGFNNTVSAIEWWMTQSNVFFAYWKLTLWPWPLVLNYHVPTMDEFSVAWPGVLGMFVYAVLTIWLVWRRRSLGFGLIWFFAVLSPTLIVPLPTEELVERRLYLPIAVVAGLFVAGLYRFAIRWREKSDRPQSDLASGLTGKPIWALGTVVALVVAGYLWVNVTTIDRLKDGRTIWVEVLKHDPLNPFAVMSQGCVEVENGNIEKGLEMLQWAYARHVRVRQGTLNYATALEKSNRLGEAISVYREAISRNSNDTVYHYNLAHLLEQVGKQELAAEHYLEAIRVDPECYPAHNNLGLIYASRNQMQMASKHFEVAVEIKPDFENCMNLMNVYLRQGQTDKATHAARRLLDAARREGRTEVAERIELGLQALENQSN